MHLPGAAVLLVLAQHPVADSAAAARSAWRETARAADLRSAYRAASRAAAAWPTQPAYVAGRARLAARLDDDTSLASALRSLASMEAGAALTRDSAVRRRAGAAPAVAAALAQLESRTAPRTASRPWRVIPDTAFYAEGVDAEPSGARVWVASVRRRTIVELGADGAVRDLDLSRHDAVGAILGVRFDARSGTLWATTAGLPQMQGWSPSDSSIAALLRIRVSDGALERRWDLPPESGGHIAGDLAIGPLGDVFVTDSRSPVIYRLRPGADTLERITHALFRSLQGVAATPDGAALYVADWSHGLIRIDLASGEAVRLEDAPGTTSLGLDGIVLARGAIVGVQNGVDPPRIARFTLDAGGTRVVAVETLDRALPEADEPTIGTLVGDDFVYVANSQWEKYDDGGNRRAGTALAPTLLLRLPL